jgi:hypothetical protein
MLCNVYYHKCFIYNDLCVSAAEVFMQICVEYDLSFAILAAEVYNKYVQA